MSLNDNTLVVIVSLFKCKETMCKYVLFVAMYVFCHLQCVTTIEEHKHEVDAAEQLYMKLFRTRRSEHLAAIKNIRNLPSYDKQYSLITLMAEKVFTIMLESRALLESSNYIPGVSQFPTDAKVKDALSNIIENTALFSETILRYPDITTSVLRQNNSWDLLLQWGIAFSYQVEYLLDKGTLKLLQLVSQELGHVERDNDYHNPYRINKNLVENPPISKKIVRKKKEIKKGPRMVHSEL